MTTLPATFDRRSTIEDLVYAFTGEAYYADYSYKEADEQRAFADLERYSDETLALLHPKLSDPNRGVRDNVLRVMIEMNAPEDTMRETLYFYDLIDVYGLQDRVPMLIKGLRNIHQLPKYDDYSSAPEVIKSQCVALMSVAHSLLMRDSTTRLATTSAATPVTIHLTDDTLIELVMSNYQKFDLITDAIKEGRTTVEGIHAVLDSPVPALAQGAL